MRMGIGLGINSPWRTGSAGGGGPAPEALTATIAPVAALATFQGTTVDKPWTNTGNVVINDTTVATAQLDSNQRSDYLSVSLAATSLPTDARIDGIRVNIRGRTSTGTMFVEACYLTDATGNEPSGIPMYSTTPTFGTTTSTVQMGGPTQTWGLPLTPQALNAGKIGVAVSIRRSAGSAGLRTLSVEYISAEVFYTTVVGSATMPKMAVATVMLRGNQNGNIPDKLNRIFFPSHGTPAAIYFYAEALSRAQLATGDATLATRASIYGSQGFAVPGQQASALRTVANGGTVGNITFHSENALPTGQSGHGPQTPNFVLQNDASLRFEFPTFGTDYVDCFQPSTFANSDMLVTVVAFFGVSAHLLHRGGWSAPDVDATVTTGFNPDLLMCVGSDWPNSAAHDAYSMAILGLAKRTGSSWQQAVMNYSIASRWYQGVPMVQAEMPDTLQAIITMSDAIHYHVNFNEETAFDPDYLTYRTEITGSTSTGYTIAPKDAVRNPIEDGMAILAIGGLPNVAIGFADSPTTTGDWTLNVGFKPVATLSMWSLATTLGRVQDSAEADGMAVMTTGAADAWSQGEHLPNASAVSPTPSINAGCFMFKGLRVRSGTFASPVDRVVATFKENSATGPTFTVTTADATARKLMYLAVGA